MKIKQLLKKLNSPQLTKVIANEKRGEAKSNPIRLTT
jgi:hypothetical protein